MKQEMEDCMMLRNLVDHYATESEKNNQDYYREIFRPYIKLKAGRSRYRSTKMGNRWWTSLMRHILPDPIVTLVTEEEDKDKLTLYVVLCAIMINISRWKAAGGLPNVNSILFYSSVPPLA